MLLQLLLAVLPTDAVRRNKLTQSASDADVERVVREWLRTAADRSGGRRQRDANHARAHSEPRAASTAYTDTD